MPDSIRSATVRLEAQVAGYIADMKAAGKATDDAFKTSSVSARRLDQDIKGVSTRAQDLSRHTSTLEGDFSRARSEADRLGTSVQRLGTTSARTSTTQTRLSQDVDRVQRSMQRGGSGLDSYTDRLGVLVAAIGAVGPALGPVGAVGLTGLAGLANDAGAAAVAGGSLIVAFHGVGKALDAVNKAALEPTATNIAAAKLQMEQLSPAARRFVSDLQGLRPLLGKLQGAAASGWFPGLDKALHELVPLAPTIEKIFHDVGKMGGRLAARGAQALAGPEYAAFFKMIDTQAPKAMAALGHVVGSLTHGLSQLWIAFAPPSNSFNNWLVSAAKSFDSWATGLKKTDGFKEFIAYVSKNGPKVATAAGAIANAVLQIVEAAAPLGGPTLQIITHLADLIGSIANSPLGTPLIALAQMASTVSLLKKGLGGVGGLLGGLLGERGGSFLDGLTENLGPDMDKLKEGLSGIRTNVVGLIRSNGEAAGSWRALGTSAVAVGGQVLKATGPMIGMAAAQTSFAKQQGISNTAMYAGMGLMAGPWGAAAGATVGALIDMTSASSQVSGSVKKMDATFSSSTSTLRDQTKALAQVQQSIKSTYDHPGVGLALQYGFQTFLGLQTTVAKNYDDMLAKLQANQHAAAAFYTIAGKLQSDVGGGLDLNTTTGSGNNKLLAFADRLAPAMERAGISVEDLGNAFDAAFGPSSTAATQQAWTDMVAKLTRTIAYMDSDKGKIASFADAMRTVSDPTYAAAKSADALSAALSNLFDPKLNAAAATDAWIVAAKALRGLKDSAGFKLTGIEGASTSKATLQNRALVHDYVASIKERITAAAAAGASEGRLARILQGSQHVLRANGAAAAAYGRQLGLTPHLVRTIVRQVNMDKARAAVKDLIRRYNALPTKVTTELKSKGIPQTKADAKKMAQDLNLVGKKRTAFIDFSGKAAQQGIKTVDDLLTKVDKKKTTPKVDVNTTAGMTKLRTLQQTIDAIHGKTVQINVQRFGPGNLNPGGLSANGSADGSTVPKTGMPYADRHLYLLADGEEVVSNRYGQADRHRGLLKDINANRLAGGGTTGGNGPVVYTRANTPDPGWKNLRDHLKATTKELENEKNARSKLVSKMTSLSTSVQDGLRTDLFGQSNPWQSKFGAGTPSGVMGTLRGDNSNIRTEIKAIKTLRSKGVTGDALAAILAQGGLEGAKEFAALPAKELAAYERLFNQRARLLHSVGSLAGSAAYGSRLSDETRAIHTLTTEVRQLKRQLHHAEQQAHKDRKDHTNSQKRGVSSSARKNARP